VIFTLNDAMTVPVASLLARLAGFFERRRSLLLPAMLTLLHLMLLQGLDDGTARSFFLAHLGLALLWQPFVRPDRRLNPASLALLILISLLSFVGFGAPLIAFWTMLLASVIGGKVLLHASRATRLAYLLALGYLIVLLLVFLIPAIVPGATLGAPLGEVLAYYILPAVLLVLAILPAERETPLRCVDPIVGVFIFLLLAVLVLGSLTLMALFGQPYVSALLATLFALGLALLALGWSWAARSGLGGLVSRYILSIGLPLEQWLHALTELNVREDTPDAFLRAACDEMCQRLPWVLGGDWQTAQDRATFGQQRGRRSEFRHQELTLGIRSAHVLSPALVWHFDLLAQLLAEFHQHKLRARTLRQLSYLQAIHETGARLTHDIKNLLQSLETLSNVAAREGETPSREFLYLVRRQLPAIYDRLSQTVRKLGASNAGNGLPDGGDGASPLAADVWCENLARRYTSQPIAFALGDPAPEKVPAWFDTVAENLLDNALAKRRLFPALHITLTLGRDAQGAATLTVIDDGQPVPSALLADLFRSPLPSLTGLGIGLYQSARLAQAAGYRLRLSENRAGAVRFTLAPSPPSGAD